MTTNEDLLSIVPSQQASDIVEELDDVEGHGLKEVVVGLSAAAVLSGGAAAAASTITAPDHGLKTPATVVAAVDALQEDADRMTAPTASKASSHVEPAKASAHHTASSATTTATEGVEEIVAWADDMAADRISDTQAAVKDVKDNWRTTVRGVANPVAAQVYGAQATATSAVTDTLSSGKSTLTVIDSTLADGVAGAMDVVMGLRSTDAGAGAQAQSRDAWVVAKIGNEVVGSGRMADGQVTVTIESRHLSSPITFSVGGDQDIAPVTVQLAH